MVLAVRLDWGGAAEGSEAVESVSDRGGLEARLKGAWADCCWECLPTWRLQAPRLPGLDTLVRATSMGAESYAGRMGGPWRRMLLVATLYVG